MPDSPPPSRRSRARGAHFLHTPADWLQPVDLTALFPRPGPVHADLGSGDGSFVVAMARAHPAANFLGIERLHGRIQTTCRKADVAGLDNLRLLRVECAYAVSHLLPPGSLHRLYLLFPDPWPKRRHWPRRLVQPAFLQAAAAALAPGGDLCIKTDDADYFAHIEKTAAACPAFTRLPWDEPMPPTDFERHYTAQGRPFHSIRLSKESPAT